MERFDHTRRYLIWERTNAIATESRVWFECRFGCTSGLFTAITTTGLRPYLHTHQTPSHLNNPRDANPICLPPRPPSNGMKPLCSQPLSVKLSYPKYLTNTTLLAFSRKPCLPISGRVAERSERRCEEDTVIQDGGRGVLSLTIGIIAATSGGGEISVKGYGQETPT